MDDWLYMANQANDSLGDDFMDLDSWHQDTKPDQSGKVAKLEKSLGRGTQGQRAAKARALLKLQRGA